MNRALFLYISLNFLEAALPDGRVASLFCSARRGVRTDAAWPFGRQKRLFVCSFR